MRKIYRSKPDKKTASLFFRKLWGRARNEGTRKRETDFGAASHFHSLLLSFFSPPFPSLSIKSTLTQFGAGEKKVWDGEEVALAFLQPQEGELSWQKSHKTKPDSPSVRPLWLDYLATSLSTQKYFFIYLYSPLFLCVRFSLLAHRCLFLVEIQLEPVELLGAVVGNKKGHLFLPLRLALFKVGGNVQPSLASLPRQSRVFLTTTTGTLPRPLPTINSFTAQPRPPAKPSPSPATIAAQAPADNGLLPAILYHIPLYPFQSFTSTFHLLCFYFSPLANCALVVAFWQKKKGCMDVQSTFALTL